MNVPISFTTVQQYCPEVLPLAEADRLKYHAKQRKTAKYPLDCSIPMDTLEWVLVYGVRANSFTMSNFIQRTTLLPVKQIALTPEDVERELGDIVNRIDTIHCGCSIRHTKPRTQPLWVFNHDVKKAAWAVDIVKGFLRPEWTMRMLANQRLANLAPEMSTQEFQSLMQDLGQGFLVVGVK